MAIRPAERRTLTSSAWINIRYAFAVSQRLRLPNEATKLRGQSLAYPAFAADSCCEEFSLLTFIPKMTHDVIWKARFHTFFAQ
jgi:hypothetical protein